MPNSSSSTKSKRASATGFSPGIYERIKVLEKVPHKGDWWRATVLRLAVKKTSITWTEKNTRDTFTLTTQNSAWISRVDQYGSS